MNRLVLVLASLSLLAFLPAPAQAHVVVCPFGDVVCLVECEASHSGGGTHACGMESSSLAEPDAPIVEVRPCPPPTMGVQVLVNGRPVTRCFV